MIRCRHCGTDNQDTATYCDECGAKLDWSASGPKFPVTVLSGEEVADTPGSRRGPPPPPQKSLAGIEGDWSVEADPQHQIRPSRTDLPPGTQATLVITRGGRAGHTFVLQGSEWLIGRWDPNHGVFPDIDLDSDDPEANVSRRHARLVVREGQYLIEDLGSTNGTFINRGQRLTPGLRYLIQDGDEIIVGKTFLRFKLG